MVKSKARRAPSTTSPARRAGAIAKSRLPPPSLPPSAAAAAASGDSSAADTGAVAAAAVPTPSPVLARGSRRRAAARARTAATRAWAVDGARRAAVTAAPSPAVAAKRWGLALKSLGEALPEVELDGSLPGPTRKGKSKAHVPNLARPKARRRLAVDESAAVRGVLEHPAFTADPLAVRGGWALLAGFFVFKHSCCALWQPAACSGSSVAACDREVVCDDSLLRFRSPVATAFWLEPLHATPSSCIHLLSPGAPPAPEEHRDPAGCGPSSPCAQALQAKTAGRCRRRPPCTCQRQGQSYTGQFVSQRQTPSVIQEQGRGRCVQGGKAQPSGCQGRRCRSGRQKATGIGSDWGEACQRALGTRTCSKGWGWGGVGLKLKRH